MCFPILHLPSPMCSVLGSTGPFVLETNSVWPWLLAFVHDGSGQTGANQAESGGGERKESSFPLERNPWLFGGALQVERWRGLLPCLLLLVAQDQLCVGVVTAGILAGADAAGSRSGAEGPAVGLFLGLCLYLSKDGNHLERRAWVAKDRVTPVQGHLRLSHERGVLPLLVSCVGLLGSSVRGSSWRLSPLLLSSYHQEGSGAGCL